MNKYIDDKFYCILNSRPLLLLALVRKDMVKVIEVKR